LRDITLNKRKKQELDQYMHIKHEEIVLKKRELPLQQLKRRELDKEPFESLVLQALVGLRLKRKRVKCDIRKCCCC
jgi:hypothetical protein